MSEKIKKTEETTIPELRFHGSRKSFLVFSGASLAVTGLFLAGCNNDDDPMMPGVNLADPTSLMASNVTAGQIVLSWTDNSQGEAGFKVERSTTAASGFQEIGQVGADITTYTDTSVDVNTEYFYRVRAFTSTMTSGYTAVVSSESGTVAVNLGSGDVGILNYAYALEQLEAAFYTAVIGGGYYASASPAEKEIILDLQKHEVIHREFFKAAITAAAPADIIPSLEVDFSAINFNERASVLATAQTFEDLGVSAYNGAGQFIVNPDYLVLAGKIVSVEARHASAIRDLLNPNSADFAGDDIINTSGLEITRSIPDVLAAAGAFITTPLDASGLPTGGFQIAV